MVIQTIKASETLYYMLSKITVTCMEFSVILSESSWRVLKVLIERVLQVIGTDGNLASIKTSWSQHGPGINQVGF